MQILLTGFEPFDGRDANPSEQAARALEGERFGAFQVKSAILPVDRTAAPRCLLEAIQAHQPTVVVCLGEASSNAGLAIERVALNLLDFRIADNAGNQVVDEAVVPGGPAAYFATLPVRAMLAAVLEEGIPAELSLSAGTFLCNQVMYTLLHHAHQAGRGLSGGFIHLPTLPDQAARARKLIPSMSLETSIRAVKAALLAVTRLHDTSR